MVSKSPKTSFFKAMVLISVATLNLQLAHAKGGQGQNPSPGNPGNPGSELPEMCLNLQHSGCNISVNAQTYFCFENPTSGRVELHPVVPFPSFGYGPGSVSLTAEDGEYVTVNFSEMTANGSHATAFKSDGGPFAGTVYNSTFGNYITFVNGEMSGGYTRDDMCAPY